MESALLAVGAGAFTQLVLFAFTFGRVREKVDSLAESVKGHEKRLQTVERILL